MSGSGNKSGNWDTMAYKAGLGCPADHPDVTDVAWLKTSQGMTQKLTFKDGSQQTRWFASPEVQHDLRDLTLERDGIGGWRRRPRSKTLFDIQEMPREKWAWVVETRRKMFVHGEDGAGNPVEDEVWGDFRHSFRVKPYGFSDRASALRRMIDLMKKDSYNLGLGIVEYRVWPHYLGYVPLDEPWYVKTWTAPVFPEPDSIPPRSTK